MTVVSLRASTTSSAADQGGCRQIFLAGDGDQILLDLPAHMLDKPSFAAACWALEQKGQALGVGGLKYLYLVGQGQVVRRITHRGIPRLKKSAYHASPACLMPKPA